MQIQELKGFEPPSIFSVREPIVKIEIKLGEFADIPTKDIDKLNQNIIRLFPGIKDHKCTKGYVGGFVSYVFYPRNVFLFSMLPFPLLFLLFNQIQNTDFASINYFPLRSVD